MSPHQDQKIAAFGSSYGWGVRGILLSAHTTLRALTFLRQWRTSATTTANTTTPSAIGKRYGFRLPNIVSSAWPAQYPALANSVAQTTAPTAFNSVNRS